MASGLEDVVCSTKLWPWLLATEVYPGPDPAEWGEDPDLNHVDIGNRLGHNRRVIREAQVARVVCRVGCSGNSSRARHKRGDGLHNGDSSEVLN